MVFMKYIILNAFLLATLEMKIAFYEKSNSIMPNWYFLYFFFFMTLMST